MFYSLRPVVSAPCRSRFPSCTSSLLVMASLLLAAPDARAGSWQFTCTGSGSKSGTVSYTFYGTPGGGSGSTPWTPPVSTTGTYFQIPSFGYDSLPGGTFGSVPTNDSQSQSVTVSPVLTVTWVPDPSLPSDPAPTSVIMSETSSATWTAQYTDGTPGVYYGGGAADDGLGDPLVKTYSGGAQLGGTMSCTNAAHYSTPSVSGGNVTVPSHTFTASANASLPNDGSQGSMNVGCLFGGYSLVLAVPTVSIGGTYDPTHGDYRVLTGQPITATLQGIPSGFTVTKYTWTVGGSTFKTYNENAPSNQLVPLGPSDLTGPVSGSTSVSALNFYDRVKEDLTVTCAVTMTAPDGKTVLNITATAPQINVLKPTATWGITTGNVQHSTANSTAAGDAYGLYPAFGSGAPGGVYWHDVVVTVPPPFSGGTCCFTQLVQPNHQYDGIGIGANNNVNGLDNSFKYFNYTWAPGSKGTENDSPAILAGPGKKVGDVDTANDSFQTWIMYQPTGGIWVPLQMYSYSWAVTLTWADPGVAWSVSGQNPAPPNPGPAATPNDAKDPPQWSVVQVNNE